MTDVIKFSKKAFTWSVVLMTILWSMGVAALAPATVHAAECPELDPGTNFTVVGGSAVYYLDANLEKRAYQHETQFRMWNMGEGENVWAEVVEIASECADNYSLPSELPLWVGPFPGTLVTNNETANVYVVGENQMIWRIPSEEVATSFWGANVFSRVIDIFPTYWVNFDVQAEEFDGSALLNGMLVSYEGNMYRMMDGMLYMVDGDLPSGAVAAAVMATADQWAAWSGNVADETVTADSVIENVAQADGATPSDNNDSNDEEVPADVNVSVSLSASSPAGTTVPKNVDNVVFTKLVFKNNGSDSAKVNSVRIVRSGLGATSDFTSVTLYDGATKLGSSRSSWTSDSYMTYNIPGGWNIPAGASKTLTIEGRLAQHGTYNALGVSMVSVSEGSVAGLPVYGNEMLGVAVSVGTVTVTGQGTASQTKKIGTNDVTLAEFRLELNGTENGYLQSVTLENKGTANPDDVANLYLYRGATQVAGPAQINSNDQVVFVLNEEYMLEKSKSHDFKVKGDIVDGDTKNVKFVLDDTTDLRVKGAMYKTSMSITSGDFNGTDDSGVTATTIDGAELNISFTSAAIDTPDDRDNLEFGKLTLSAGSTDVEITSIVLTIDETDGNSDATDNLDVDEFELVAKDGSLYSGTMTNGGDADADNETWTFSDSIYLTAGEPMEFTLRGDLPSGIGADDSYRVTMTVNTSNLVAETKPGNDTVDNFSVGSITGKLVTVKDPELTVRSTQMNNEDAVYNETNVVLYQGTMEASVASDVNIESVKFEGGHTGVANLTYTAANFDKDNWSQVGFYTWNAASESWVEQDLLTSSALVDGSLTFGDLDFDVPAGSGNRITFAVMGTLKGTFDDTNRTVHLQLETVTARDSDNTVVTPKTAAGATIADGAELEIVRTVTLQPTGVLYLSLRNNDAGYNKNRIMLAGDGAFVGKLRVRADYEDILLRDLKLKNGSADDEDSVDSVCLYSNSVADAEHLIACTTLDGSNDIAFFNDIDVLVTEGTHNWYIYVKSRPMGKDANATADTHDEIYFTLPASSTTGAVVARGSDNGSGAELSMGDQDGTVTAGEIVYDFDLDGNFDEAGDTTTAASKTFEIAGSKITDVSLISFYGASTYDAAPYKVANKISGTGTYTVAILKVTTAGHNNTTASGDALKLTLDGFVFDVEKHSTTTISSVTLERINGASGAATVTDDAVDAVGETSGDWTLSGATSSLGVDAQIDAGDTAYFEVKAQIGSLDTRTGVEDHIRVSLDNLSPSNAAINNIDWFDGYAGLRGDNTNFDYLRLENNSVTGIKVSENL